MHFDAQKLGDWNERLLEMKMPPCGQQASRFQVPHSHPKTGVLGVKSIKYA
jgi:hypothetical protein